MNKITLSALAIALGLQAMQASPYVAMAWLTHSNDLMPLLTSVMLWGALFMTGVKSVEMACHRGREQGVTSYRTLATFLVTSAAYWLLTFNGLQKFGAIAVLCTAIVAAIVQPALAPWVLKAPKHQVGSNAKLLLTTLMLIFAGGLIMKTRYVGAEAEWAAIANVYGVGQLLLLGFVQALNAIIKIRLTDEVECELRGVRPLGSTGVVWIEMVMVGLMGFIITLAQGNIDGLYSLFPSSTDFQNWTWSWSIFWVIYIGIFPTAIGMAGNLYIGKRLGTPLSAGLSYSKPLFAEIQQATFQTSVFRADVGWDLLTAALMAGYGAYQGADKEDEKTRSSRR